MSQEISPSRRVRRSLDHRACSASTSAIGTSRGSTGSSRRHTSLVTKSLFTKEDFRELSFENPTRLYLPPSEPGGALDVMGQIAFLM